MPSATQEMPHAQGQVIQHVVEDEVKYDDNDGYVQAPPPPSEVHYNDRTTPSPLPPTRGYSVGPRTSTPSPPPPPPQTASMRADPDLYRGVKGPSAVSSEDAAEDQAADCSGRTRTSTTSTLYATQNRYNAIIEIEERTGGRGFHS